MASMSSPLSIARRRSSPKPRPTCAARRCGARSSPSWSWPPYCSTGAARSSPRRRRPSSLVAAALVLCNCEVTTFDAIVVAGLAIALVVVIDDAVVSADNLVRQRDQSGEAGSRSPMSSCVRPSPTAPVRHLRRGDPRGWRWYPLFVIEGLSGDAFLPPLAASYAACRRGVAVGVPHGGAGPVRALPAGGGRSPEARARRSAGWPAGTRGSSPRRWPAPSWQVSLAVAVLLVGSGLPA